MYTISNNTPSPGYIQWADLKMSYLGTTHNIANGSTTYKFVYWLSADPTALYGSNTYPTLGPTDCLVFLNKSGIAMVVPSATVLDGGLIVPGSIYANAIAANTITAASGVIADAAITNAKIVSVTADKITTGLLDSVNGKTYFNLDTAEIKESSSQNITESITVVDTVEGTLSTSTGAEGTGSTYGRTGFYAIMPSTAVTVAGTMFTCYRFFYTAAKAFISYATSNGNSPANAAYVRLRFYNAGVAYSTWKAGISGTLAITIPIVLTINPTLGFDLKKGDETILGTNAGQVFLGETLLLKRLVPATGTEFLKMLGKKGIIFDENAVPAGTIANAFIEMMDYQTILSAPDPKPVLRISSSYKLQLDGPGGTLLIDDNGIACDSKPEDAITATYQNSWVTYSAGHDAKYYKHDGRVYLSGTVKNGTSGSIIFTLPVGYRPIHAQYFPVVANGTFGYCSLNTNGTVSASLGSTAWFSLAGISFMV